ncbi:Retrieval of early ER protein Rer1 [Phytophthora cactorum]|nr:Retrieval of early ER protein Rer1 [Phytophthora cactorum]
MEVNAQYALHDSEAAPPAWAARVRLTPELLEKLRQTPQQVLLKLNVANGDGASKARGSSKKTSVMTVKLAADGEEETEEQYELLSFPEDPSINHVCTFRREGGGGAVGGYSIYKTGTIHQKLLVQRLLDATEKDRIKDKHAKSVLASKQRLTRLSSVPTSRTSGGGSAWSVAAGHKRAKKLVLPSALTKEEAKEAKEKIEKGFEVEVAEASSASRTEDKTVECEAEDNASEEAPTVVVSQETAAAARDGEFYALFSSDSDDEGAGVGRRRQKKKTATDVKEHKSTAAPSVDEQLESKSVTGTKKKGSLGSNSDATAQPKEPTTSATGHSVNAEPAKSESNLPATSELPWSIDNPRRERLCSFVETHEQFRQDWEMLDKAYSIEMIKTEGLHLQLEVVSPDRNCEQLQQKIKASCSKKEGGDSRSLTEPPFIARVSVSIKRKWQYLLDKSTIHVYGRWGVALGLLLLYLVRVFYLNAFHIVTYGLGIYLLNLFIGFLSPQMDTESDGPLLPHKQSEEFRPFTRRVPEFQFWYSTFKATVVSLLMTLSSAFDVPVFWPILLIYFIVLFALTMKRQIKHMWKHNYVPWDHGKQVYKGKKNSK